MVLWQDELSSGLRQARALAADPSGPWLSLPQEDQPAVAAARERFPFLVPTGYADLIDWNDPGDPLRQLLMPTAAEDSPDGSLDTSGEALSTIVPGLQHKYEQTAVFLLTEACAGHCRYCFRRRLMSRDVMTKETIEDLEAAVAYVAAHPEVENVLLSGGDPMICSTRRLERLFEALSPIRHLWQLRISTKLPAFLPSRFSTDPALLALLHRLRTRFQIVVQCHFDHPREITPAAERAIEALRESGCLLTAQIPLMKGVNADVDVLTELFKRLHRLGVLPQYLFHPRPVQHATHFQLPLLDGLALVEAVRRRCNGPVKRFRYILTHADGKLELVGQLPGRDGELVCRWHQVRRGITREGLHLAQITPETTWLQQ
ncbi:KamA family radical SAM protein [Synechococcus sp. CCY 0621]|uniref:KamA family radical SAM protein n=1 Tax=Synechococcus sp. CCY 0621 TaxID=2815603 RepID=UPI001C2353EC|nr:KamA family radical SAM protein [Synechococcus sp. CCY 0621]